MGGTVFGTKCTTQLGLKLKGVFCKQIPYLPIVFQPIFLLPGCHTNTDTHADANAITDQLTSWC